MKRLIPLTVLFALLSMHAASSVYAAGGSAHRQQVETLFRLTQMEKKVDESVNSILQLQLQQNPQLAQHREKLRAFFEQHIGWKALKEAVAGMYMETFTEDELKQINDFYITPAGQKVINTVPVLVQQRNQLAMKRLQENIGELHKLMGSPPPGHPSP